MTAASTRTVSIYRSLFGSLLVVVVLLSGAILAVTTAQARGAVRELSRKAIVQSTREVEAQLHLLFQPAETMLLLMRDYGLEGRLEFDDTESFIKGMAPVIERQRKVTSLLLADESGRERMLLDGGDRWITRETRPDEWGAMAVWTERTGVLGEPRVHDEEFHYDCRERPWFKQAIPGEVRWTDPYPFATTGDPGITVSIRFPGKDGTERVLGFDVKLQDISGYTMRLRPSPSGRAFVLADDGRVLGLPGDARFDDPVARADALLKLPIDLGVPVVFDAASAYRKRGEDSADPFRFESGGEAWWAGLRAFPLGPRRRLLLAVVVPESDLLGDTRAQRAWILLATAAVLGFAAWYAMRLARRYSVPIGKLVRQSARIRGGDFEPAPAIETRLREVHALAAAQDEMRVGLKTLFRISRDLEIARQIQQKTLPAKLPRLPGFDLGACSEPAEETGGDTYDIVGFRTVEHDGVARTTIVDDDADAALLLLADATGHGIGPALSVTQVRAMLRMAARQSDDLAGTVRSMNEQLHADLTGDRFVTAWFGVLDAPERTLTSFSAGQGPILHYVAAQDAFREGRANAPPLGVVEDAPIELPPPTRLEPGDLFLVFSDGFSEAMGADRDQFGVERIQEVVRRHRDGTASDILGAIRRAVDEFTGHAPLEDDRTAIVIRRV